MSDSTIHHALGVLQGEADNEQAWGELRAALGFSGGGAVDPGELGAERLAELLEAARRAHEARHEHEAVSKLLEIEAALATGEREADLVAELARVRDDLLLDDAGAVAAYRALLALRPKDPAAEEALERAEVRRARWQDLEGRYVEEAASATGDPAFKSSLLVSAAEVAYRYGVSERAEAEPAPKSVRSGKKKKKGAGDGAGDAGDARRRERLDAIVARLREAASLDPNNRRATALLERILRDEGRWEELAEALEASASGDRSKEDTVASLVRLARVAAKKLGSKERAAAAYERVLDREPGHAEAINALVDFFTEKEMWEHLVSLYEGQLGGGGVRAGQEAGVILQIAMVHWKMRGKAEAAEPYFDRLRKLEPAHPGMLAFFREVCAARGEQARLVQILSDAQRALPEGAERSALAAEIAHLAEQGKNAQKAIEQWRAILRSDPANADAHAALARLYREAGAFNHLADLRRMQLDRVAPDDAAGRLPLLREIAQIYREHIKSDSALVTVLSQTIALDPHDRDAVRELARVYESLGRWRDLLTTQMRLADLAPDPAEKAELYRAIARRWLDQFSNVQNAVDAYEKLREAVPDDREAVGKLRELYTKRRAYRQLFDLYEGEAARAEGEERRALWLEMAKLASDRLDRGADAAKLYKQVLAEAPDDTSALDALEKQAERDKDYATVAEALERRAELAGDPQARLAVLQKLGSIYADRLSDHAGALRTWRRVLALSPGHAKALRILRESYLAMADYDGLTELYAESNDWEGLVEVLSSTADRVADEATKIDLSYRSASIYEDKLGAPERAFRSYERVLSVRPDDARAATALVPLYEADEKWARLPGLYEVLLKHAEGPTERRALYRKLAAVAGSKLSDKAAAFRYAEKAFALAPSEPSSLRELEEWARASGEWTAFAGVIEARAASPEASADERRSLRLKLAEVSATHAGRPDEAIRAYRELVEAGEADDAALAALDRLLRASPDRRDDLRWLLRVRASRADGPDAKAAVLAEWALLEEEAFGDPAAAIGLHREVLEVAPSNVRALRALARLLLASGEAEQAAKVLERERDLGDGESRVEREIELARLYMGPLANPLEALAASKRALELSPHDPGVVAVVEDLLKVSETRAAAAAVLDEAYAATGAWAKQAEVLGVLVATAASKADRLSLFGRLAEVKQKLGDHGGAFDVVARAAREYPAELDLWDALSVLANKTQRAQEFVDAIAGALAASLEARGEGASPQGDLPANVEVDLCERAATLYDEMLGEIDRAAPYLERVLTRDPTNDRAFLRLKQILTTRERWADLESLYERVLEATDDPARRADLLAEVALVAEEITGDANKAIRFYERILEIEPGHDQAIFALDKLYAGAERWQNLADLLARRISLAGTSDTSALKLRLGALLVQRLGDPKAALDQVEEVVTQDSSIREARELVEGCLAHPDLRQRAAIILEGVYVEREEMRDLVRVLEVRLEFVADDVERRDLLRRIAELRDERLTDDQGAFEAYGRLLPLSPADVEARARFLEIAARRGRREEAADVLLAAAKNAEAPQPRAELLFDVARIYEETDQSERAEAVHRQVLELSPDDPSIALPATRALERLYTSQGKTRELCDVLRIQVTLEEGPDARRDLYGRLGKLAEEVLSDDAAAIAAWRQRLDDDPGDDEALVALDRLYERTGDHRALVEVLRLREQREAGGEARRELMVRVAQTLADRLGEAAEAVVAYRAVLDDFGADRASLAALAALYTKTEAWPDLAEVLEEELALATDDASRLALLARLGDVRRTRLGEVESALDAYRRALALDPNDAPARAALEQLLDDEGAREEAAEILRPLYEGSGDDLKLLRVLEIQVDGEAAVDARLALFARAADVAEGPLADGARAFAYASRGLREAVTDDSLGQWIERAERLAAATGQYAELVQLYRDAIADVLDEERQVEMIMRVAELARTRLSDAALAKQQYRRALDARPEEPRVLVALEELHEEAGEHEALFEILTRRAEAAESDEARRAILYKQARLCDEALSDRARAIVVYEQILETGFDPPAVSALERLYTAQARWGDLVALYERELAAEGGSAERRAALHHALGHVHERETGEIERAFDEYAEALRDVPTHEATIASLERLMEGKTYAARAAEMLEAVYLARLDWRKVMSSIAARLDDCEDPDDRRALLRRLAKLHEEQEENYRAALDVTARLLSEDVTDDATWAELERLARVANAEDRLAEIFATELERVTSDEPATARLSMRTGELFEGAGDVERALSFYRRAYDFAPEEQTAAFAAIDRLLARAGRAADRVTLYREALEHRTGAEERAATLRAIANIEERDLSDDDAAIATYRALLDVDETDAGALDALSALYTRRERFRDLADLLRRRASLSALPEEEASYRLELARVLDDSLGERGAAVDELETVVGLVSTEAGPGAAAVEALRALLSHEEQRARVIELLAPIYERADDWARLVDLAKHRFTVAASPGEKVAVLRETASLLEQRGGDVDNAFDCLVEAFGLDPDDGDTREELDRLAVATERWDELAAAYEKGIAMIDGVGQRELLESLAKLHDKRRDDPRKALEAWQRLFALDESDPHPLGEIDLLATLLSDWPALVRALDKRVELTPDDEERASLLRRVGEARRDMLEDAEGAIEAYERALEIEPDSAFTLDCLIALHEEGGDAARLVDLLRRRVDVCGDDDGELRHRLLLQAASCYETGLSDRPQAIALLGEALASAPSDREVMGRLAALYEAERMWAELLDNLRAQVAIEPDAAAKVALQKKIGRLLSAELDEHDKALEAYGEVLASGYDEEAARAVFAIGEARDELRREAARLLEPVLREAERFGDLVEALEMRLRSETEPDERAATLRAIAEVAEQRLSDTSRAESALLRALAEQPDDEALHSEIERVAGLLGRGGWERYADALGERAAATFDARITAQLSLRIGAVAEAHLSDLPRAAEAFARAAEQGGDTVPVLAALERVYAGLDDTRALAEVLERRISIETEADAQADLYYRLAQLQLRELGDKALALGTLRLALERAPSHDGSRAAVEQLLDDGDLFSEAFDTLEGVYRATARGADLAKLYARRVDRAPGLREKTRARLELAVVLEEEGSDPVAAQRAVEEAAEGDPRDPEVVDELERLARKNGAFREAEGALARGLEALDAAARLEGGLGLGAPDAELWARLGRWRRDEAADPRGAEAAFTRALDLDPENVDLVRALEELTREPGRERDHIAVLRRLSRLAGDPEARRDLCKEAARSAEEALGDPALAEQVIRELLADDEADAWAAAELTRLREAAGDHEEVVRLLLRRAESVGGDEGLALRHRAAEVASDRLGDRAQALSLYEGIFSDEPSDARAIERLRALYQELGRHAELAKLLEALIDAAESPESRAALRLDLADLALDKMDAPRDAQDALRAVLEEDPDHDEAARKLAAIFERTGQTAELTELHAELVERARARGDAALEIERLMTLGDIQENRAQDPSAALGTYEEVVQREPSHRAALEAVARITEERELWEKAAKALRALAEAASADEAVALWLRLARAYEGLGDDGKTAEALEHALEARPDHGDVRAKLAGLYERMKRWSELAALLVASADVLAAANPGYEPPELPDVPLPVRGSMAPPAPSLPPPPEHVAEEVALLRRAAEVHLNERGEPTDAVAILERATRLVPNDRELLLLLCDAYVGAERKRDAATVLERVIASYGNRRTKELSVYYHRLGRTLASLGDKDVALSQFDMAFKIDPGSVEVLRDLGVLALESNDLDRAQKTFRALLLQRLDGDSGISKGEVFTYLGEISMKQGDKAKAVQMLERAVENEPSLDRARTMLQDLKG